MTLRLLEESTQWENRSELYIGLFANNPIVFWDYCAEQQAAITNMTAKNLFQLQGQNYHMATFTDQDEMSNICKFGWYEWVYSRDVSEPFPHLDEVLGRCIGQENNEGKKMSQWVLNINGQVVPRRYLGRLRLYGLISEVEISKRVAFNAQIKLSHGKSFTVPRMNIRRILKIRGMSKTVPYRSLRLTKWMKKGHLFHKIQSLIH